MSSLLNTRFWNIVFTKYSNWDKLNSKLIKSLLFNLSLNKSLMLFFVIFLCSKKNLKTTLLSLIIFNSTSIWFKTDSSVITPSFKYPFIFSSNSFIFLTFSFIASFIVPFFLLKSKAEWATLKSFQYSFISIVYPMYIDIT